jgi:hypothetical protein
MTMLPKRILNVALLLLLAGTIAFGLAHSAHVAGQDASSPAAGQDAAAKIADAMSAGPASIAENATILDNELDDAGNFVVLREGSNGWYCSPDALGTPGPDPWCYDQTWLDWSYALVAGEEPTTTVLGLSYMLQGGSDASNTDPFATEPAAGEEWMTTPPHVMFLLPGKIDHTAFSTDHLSGGPWIMWAGTPYEHIMMPLPEGENAGQHAHAHTATH